jgi:predicted nucleic acid-binding protein
MQKIYLDVCALNRLTDDQSQPRIRSEAEAVQEILHVVWRGQVQWLTSRLVQVELRRNPDRGRRQEVQALLVFAHGILLPDSKTFERAHTLEQSGYGAFDALHLACDEQAAVDALITTDDRFLRQAGRGLGEPMISIQNPIDRLRSMRG